MTEQEIANLTDNERLEAQVELESQAQFRSLTSLTYFDVRGAFYRVQLLDQSGKARGVYAIEELNATRDDESGQQESPILLTGVETAQSDVVGLMSCLNNSKVIYTFGQSFGNVSITGEILLGPLGNMPEGERGGVRRILDFFWRHRVSIYEKPITVSVNGEAFYVYLTGLRLGAVDRNLHVMGFMLVGTLLDLSREMVEQGALVNPETAVNNQSGLEESLVIHERLQVSQAGPPANLVAASLAAPRQDWSYRDQYAVYTSGHPANMGYLRRQEAELYNNQVETVRTPSQMRKDRRDQLQRLQSLTRDEASTLETRFGASGLDIKWNSLTAVSDADINLDGSRVRAAGNSAIPTAESFPYRIDGRPVDAKTYYQQTAPTAATVLNQLRRQAEHAADQKLSGLIREPGSDLVLLSGPSLERKAFKSAYYNRPEHRTVINRSLETLRAAAAAGAYVPLSEWESEFR